MATSLTVEGVPKANYFQLNADALNYTRISSATDTTIKTGEGFLAGIFCASSSSGTVLLYDDTSKTTIAVNTTTLVAGTYHKIPLHFLKGLIITSGGTLDCTVFWS